MSKRKVSFTEALGLSKLRIPGFFNTDPSPAESSLTAPDVDRLTVVTSEAQFAYSPNNAEYRSRSTVGDNLLVNDYGAKQDNFEPIVPSVFAGKNPPPTYKIQRIDFSLVAVDLLIPIQGNCIFFVNSTNLTDSFTLKFDDATADPIPFVPGMAINQFPFTRLWLSWSVIAGAPVGFLMIVKGPENLRIT